MPRSKVRDFFRLRPFILSAACIPVIYIVFAGAYILLSGYIANKMAIDTRHLFIIESVKGIAYVLITGALLFVLCHIWLKRIQTHQMLLVESERRVMAGLTCSSIAHDLNNLLVVLKGVLDELEELDERERKPEFFLATRESLTTSIEGLSQMAKNLSRSAKQISPDEKENRNISKRLSIIARLASKHPEVRHCDLKAGDFPPIRTYLNTPLFDQAMMNLIINAAQAAGPKGIVELSLELKDRAILIHVEDSGPGIPAEKVETIFTPGFSTKPKGSGLGMLCVRAFVDSCNGTVRIEKSKLGGAAFLIQIPLHLKNEKKMVGQSDLERRRRPQNPLT